MRFEFIKNHRKVYPLEEMCECLEVSSSGYHAWLTRVPSPRSIKDESLKTRIIDLHKRSKGSYGYRPIHDHLCDEELGCGRDRTLRLMRELDIRGSQKASFKPLSTDSRHDFGYSPNRLKELGEPERCDQVWVADTTYLRTAQGWAYLATVMDLFSRRIIGWSVSDHNDADLCVRALEAALLTRGGELSTGLIHHSDRGSTYASYKYQSKLQSWKICQSMSAKGNCYDNAAMESFYGRFKVAAIGDSTFTDVDHARSAAFEYIETFYNRFRKHSSLGYNSPVLFEEKFAPPMGGMETSLTACINRN
jgi:putative transposase